MKFIRNWGCYARNTDITIPVGTERIVDHYLHKCELLDQGRVRYTANCIISFILLSELLQPVLVLSCKKEKKELIILTWQIWFVFMDQQLLIWNTGFIFLLEEVTVIGCKKDNEFFNEGQIWTSEHIRYQCTSYGIVRVLGEF